MAVSVAPRREARDGNGRPAPHRRRGGDVQHTGPGEEEPKGANWARHPHVSRLPLYSTGAIVFVARRGAAADTTNQRRNTP